MVRNRNFQAVSPLIFGKEKFLWGKWLEIKIALAVPPNEPETYGKWLKKGHKKLLMKIEKLLSQNEKFGWMNKKS